VGVLLQVIADQLHPAHTHPNDSAAAFAGYARSDTWVSVHIGQFLGTLRVFTVQMAVDGAALKAAVGVWSHAADADKPTAVLMADDIRSIEKGPGASSRWPMD
jgi:hypothetical protein